MNQSIGDTISTPGEKQQFCTSEANVSVGLLLHVNHFSNFLSEDPVCSVPGRGTIVPMTRIRNEPTSSSRTALITWGIRRDASGINSHDAASLYVINTLLLEGTENLPSP